MGGALKVVAGTGSHLVHEHFFGNTTAKQHADLIEHVFAVVAVPVFFGQAHSHTQRTATWNDSYLVNRVTLGQHFANQRMA